MEISNCVIGDLNTIFNLYDDARQLQTERNRVVWPFFEKNFLQNEIANKQRRKIVIEGEIACNWTITMTDKEIWRRKKEETQFILIGLRLTGILEVIIS